MSAFEAWYREAYPDLFVSVFRITHGNRAMTEDLCHDAILDFVTNGHLQKAANAQDALAYVRRMTANAYIDQIRRATRTANLPTEQIDGSDPGETARAAQDVYTLLVDRLPPEDHAILGMMFAGEPLSRIAAALRISYSGAGVRVHKIRNLIKELYK